MALDIMKAFQFLSDRTGYPVPLSARIRESVPDISQITIYHISVNELEIISEKRNVKFHLPESLPIDNHTIMLHSFQDIIIPQIEHSTLEIFPDIMVSKHNKHLNLHINGKDYSDWRTDPKWKLQSYPIYNSPNKTRRVYQRNLPELVTVRIIAIFPVGPH
jgi:hypothetical protein